MNSLVKVVESLLAVLERHKIAEVGNVISAYRKPPSGAHHEVVEACEQMFSLGVILALSLTPAVPVEVPLVLFSIHGGATSNPDRVNRLVEAAAESNRAKLADADADADERHLFVWVDPSTSDAELAMFQDRPPHYPPALPSEIDVAWAATWGFIALGQQGIERLWRIRPPGSWERLQRPSSISE